MKRKIILCSLLIAMCLMACGKKDNKVVKEKGSEVINQGNSKVIALISDYGNIDDNVVFSYGLYLSMVAGDILGIDKDVITNIDKNLVIRRYKDIDISSEEICEILDSKPGKIISEVYDDLKNVILSRDLDNNNDSIREYIFNNRKKWLDEGAIIQGIVF